MYAIGHPDLPISRASNPLPSTEQYLRRILHSVTSLADTFKKDMSLRVFTVPDPHIDRLPILLNGPIDLCGDPVHSHYTMTKLGTASGLEPLRETSMRRTCLLPHSIAAKLGGLKG